MEPQAQQPQEAMGDDEAIKQIVHAHHFVRTFKKRAYSSKNIKVLKSAYNDHMQKAAKIKKILKKLGQHVTAASDSDDSSDDEGYENIQNRMVPFLMPPKRF